MWFSLATRQTEARWAVALGFLTISVSGCAEGTGDDESRPAGEGGGGGAAETTSDGGGRAGSSIEVACEAEEYPGACRCDVTGASADTPTIEGPDCQKPTEGLCCTTGSECSCRPYVCTTYGVDSASCYCGLESSALGSSDVVVTICEAAPGTVCCAQNGASGIDCACRETDTCPSGRTEVESCTFDYLSTIYFTDDEMCGGYGEETSVAGCDDPGVYDPPEPPGSGSGTGSGSGGGCDPLVCTGTFCAGDYCCSTFCDLGSCVESCY